MLALIALVRECLSESGVVPSRGWGALEHDPEKACPALDAGWVPVFGKDHALDSEALTIEREGRPPEVAAKSVGRERPSVA
jgi:hypothetical protein